MTVEFNEENIQTDFFIEEGEIQPEEVEDQETVRGEDGLVTPAPTTKRRTRVDAPRKNVKK